ncbi:MAG TPA: helix-turn-helix domain-containing protein [Candidatus Dormibacteraeota bacterium]|nr:helix-turn-helix domain-containing protein [Candidatus Dormibacteraeota bacterium]
MARLAARSKTTARSVATLPSGLVAELEHRRAGMARHMARAVVSLVRWDGSTGVPPQREAIVRACEAGLDLFLATAREARPATSEELRRVAQLGILQARSSQSVEPILAAYRIAARVAWNEILRAWRGHPDGTPEAIMVTANYVFAALDQVAADVTKTYLHAREQHMQRGTRAHARLFHALISDSFDSELELQKQALALKLPIAATGYIAVICKLIVANRDSERGGQSLEEVVASINVPRGAIHHVTDPGTLVVLWPAESPHDAEGARQLVQELQDEAVSRSGEAKARVRAGIGGYHPGLRGISRSYLEAQQAIEAGRKLRPEAIAHGHDEVIPHLVLAQNPLLAERFVAHTLGRLTDPSVRNRDQLIETLEAYLRRGSVKDAAAELKLHRHSVLYRLDRLRELLGGDLDSPPARLRLQLALDLRRLL